MSTDDDIVEDYLDELFIALRGQPRDIRRLLAEAEEHLHAVTVENLARGMSGHDAAVAAVTRFGPVDAVARAWNVSTRVQRWWLLPQRTVGQLLPLAGVGLVAIGLSGLAARVMTAIWGRRFVFADAPGTVHPAAACRHWESIHPGARSCAAAYLAEAQADGLLARYAAGVLGLALLAAIAGIRWRRGLPIVARPPLSSALTGTVLFLAAAFGLLGLGADSIRSSDSYGAGQWLAGALIALPLGVAYGLAVLRSGARAPTRLWAAS